MKYLESITDRFLGDMSSLVWGFAVILVVALLLGALHRFLQRNPGHRFRNQSTMFVAIIVGLLLIILLLPMSTQTRGQLLQLTGIVISAAIALSGGTFIANAMAGVMLKSVRNFRTGDWLEMEGVWGRVSDRGLFHTEVQTPDRDLTTLPNLLLATQAVKVVRASGTIVGATVSLGYDVHHNRCEKLLLEAANSLGLQDPFVQILDLGDYSVTYRVAGLLTETKQLIAFRSRLRAAILDSLHEGGVEIVSIRRRCRPRGRGFRQGRRSRRPQQPGSRGGKPGSGDQGGQEGPQGTGRHPPRGRRSRPEGQGKSPGAPSGATGGQRSGQDGAPLLRDLRPPALTNPRRRTSWCCRGFSPPPAIFVV